MLYEEKLARSRQNSASYGEKPRALKNANSYSEEVLRYRLI
ncbi:Uncharacterised protein [Serratia plymuthica]|nr:Uncharacterised protein [Serratia plymuthica]